MLIAIALTFLGFLFAIVLGLIGAWAGSHAGAYIGIGIGLGISFFATAYIAGR